MRNNVSDERSDVFNLVLNNNDLFCDSVNISVQLIDMSSQRRNFVRDGSVLGGEFFFLVLDFRSELFINLDGGLINLGTGVNTFLSLFFEFLGQLVLNIFNLLVDVGDLLLNVGSFSCDDCVSDLFSLNLLIDELDSLLSFLGDSRGGLFSKLGLIDLSSLFIDDGLFRLLIDDFVAFLIYGCFLSPLLVIDIL